MGRLSRVESIYSTVKSVLISFCRGFGDDGFMQMGFRRVRPTCRLTPIRSQAFAILFACSISQSPLVARQPQWIFLASFTQQKSNSGALPVQSVRPKSVRRQLHDTIDTISSSCSISPPALVKTHHQVLFCGVAFALHSNNSQLSRAKSHC
jgi:hypothetical protein